VYDRVRIRLRGFYGAAGDLGFGANPVIDVVAGLAAALLVQFKRATADFFFNSRSAFVFSGWRMGVDTNAKC
jgi:hypothetical protein